MVVLAVPENLRKASVFCVCCIEKVAAVIRYDLFLDQWVCRHRINLSGHESVVLVPRSRCWKCGEVLGRKYPIMTCLRGVSLPLWSIGPWLIRDSADSSREEPRGILVNYCCSKRPRSANASCPWNRSLSVISFLATPQVWRSISKVLSSFKKRVQSCIDILFIQPCVSCWLSSAKRSEMFYKHIYCCADRSNKNISPHLIVNNILY